MSTHHAEEKVDMTQPAGTILKTGTAKIHDEIQKNRGGSWLAKAELDREEYIRYLMMLWHIYTVLEDGLAANANDSVLSPTYNPSLLSRVSALSSDISVLLGVSDDDSSWKTHLIHKTLISSPPPPFHAYISRLAHLVEVEPRKLLAHSYIRYMGDLSGGQIMKRNVHKAYDLVGERGTTFYKFGAMRSDVNGDQFMTNMGEAKRIKEWFRSGVDVGVGNDIKLKEALLDEVTRAFFLHKDIFDDFKPPSSKTQKAAEWTPSSPVAVLRPESSRTFPVTSVLTFMVAVGLAHFIIVVGGLSGSRGYAKLEAIQAWIASAISSN